MRILRGLSAALATVIPAAVLILGPAAFLPYGTPLWARAVRFLAALAAITIGWNVALALGRPASFEARRQGFIAPKSKKPPLIDSIGLLVYLAYPIAWIVFIPVDVARLHILQPPPPWAMAVGFAMAMVGSSVAYLAVWQNQFATRTIHDQTDRGQRVVDRGLYGLIRHPLYAGNLLFFAGAALWLGSLAALVGTIVHLAATVARIAIEEDYLRSNLPDYADYARRVRARLVPFVI